MEEEVEVYLTAFDLLKEELNTKNTPIFTFSQPLDKLLNGGIHFKTITEIFGGKGVGKTTFCMQLALTIQVPEYLKGVGGECLYIDTENTFVLHRLRTMATKFVEHCTAVTSPSVKAADRKISLESVLNGIHYFNCRSTTELEEIIQSLDKYLAEHPKIRLIIIDSLAFLFYSLPSNFDSRTRMLYLLAQNLRRLMNKFNLALVVTNSMTTRFDSNGKEYYIPYLGESWTFVPNRRIQLDWEGSCRTAKLIKCSSSKTGSAQYRVVSAGIRD